MVTDRLFFWKGNDKCVSLKHGVLFYKAQSWSEVSLKVWPWSVVKIHQARPPVSSLISYLKTTEGKSHSSWEILSIFRSALFISRHSHFIPHAVSTIIRRWSERTRKGIIRDKQFQKHEKCPIKLPSQAHSSSCLFAPVEGCTPQHTRNAYFDNS